MEEKENPSCERIKHIERKMAEKKLSLSPPRFDEHPDVNLLDKDLPQEHIESVHQDQEPETPILETMTSDDKLKKRRTLFSWVSKSKETHFPKDKDKRSSDSAKADIKQPTYSDSNIEQRNNLSKTEKHLKEELGLIVPKIMISVTEEEDAEHSNDTKSKKAYKRSFSEKMPKLRLKGDSDNKLAANTFDNNNSTSNNSNNNNNESQVNNKAIGAPKLDLSTLNPENSSGDRISLSRKRSASNVPPQSETTEVELRPRSTTPTSAHMREQLTPHGVILQGTQQRETPKPTELHSSVTNEAKRKEILEELIQTEIQFIENLNIIVNVFLDPIRQANILDKIQLSSLFSNVEAIYPVNVGLLEELQLLKEARQCEDPNEGGEVECNNDVTQHEHEEGEALRVTKNIGKIFSEKSILFKLYAVYCSNQPNIHTRLVELQETNAEFALFLKKAFRRPECRKLDIESFLITPLQRLCKYPLLLKELLRNTGDDHPEYEDIKEGKEKIEVIVRQVNERVRKVENVNKLYEVNKEIQFTSFTFDILSNQNRVLVHQDKMKINGKSYYGYLFDDGLLLCTFYENEELKEAKKFISAKLALATDLPDMPPEVVNSIELAELGNKIMEIHCSSRLAKKRWLTSLQKVIEASGGASLKDKERAVKALRRASVDHALVNPRKPKPINMSKLRDAQDRGSVSPKKSPVDREKKIEKPIPSLEKTDSRSSSFLSLFAPIHSVKKLSETLERKNIESARSYSEKKSARKISNLEDQLSELKEKYAVLKDTSLSLIEVERKANEHNTRRIKELEDLVARLSNQSDHSSSSTSSSPSPSPSSSLSSLQTKAIDSGSQNSTPNLSSDVNNNNSNNNIINNNNNNGGSNNNGITCVISEKDEYYNNLLDDLIEGKCELEANTHSHSNYLPSHDHDHDHHLHHFEEPHNHNENISNHDMPHAHDDVNVENGQVILRRRAPTRRNVIEIINVDYSNQPSHSIHNHHHHESSDSSVDGDSESETSLEMENLLHLEKHIVVKDEMTQMRERIQFLSEVVETLTSENVRLRSKVQQAKIALKEFQLPINLSLDGSNE